MHEPLPSDAPALDATGRMHEHDLRKLPCPPPLQMALGLAGALAPGKTLRLLTPQCPTSLLALLAEQGLQTAVLTLPSGDVCVKIHRPVCDGQADH
jgi:hypothetical protein